MKRIILIVTTICCALVFQANAQIRYGIQGGLSSSQLNRETIQANGVSLAIKDANYGFHIGVFGRAKLTKHLYLQPEANFNSSSVDFQVTDFSDNLMNKVLTEKYRYLDIPFMLGYKLGPLRMEAGPTGHVYVASKSELGQIDGYERRFNNFNLGYQAGFGLDLWKLMITLRHEGNFQRFGDHMSIGGQDINFSQRPSRWVATVGYSF
ncbi:MAG: outer membrane beta-barrel protein [Bacteroidetes bacterium]|nr:outer membrane beta-barrel protein [Bacteroidota bacterium]